MARSVLLGRVAEPGSYQAFQHFVTNAPWSADRVWRRLRNVLPEREGLVVLDSTTFTKQGRHAVTAALWTGARAYLIGAALYLPEAWLTDEARARARIPRDVSFKQRWRRFFYVNLPATLSLPSHRETDAPTVGH